MELYIWIIKPVEDLDKEVTKEKNQQGTVMREDN